MKVIFLDFDGVMVPFAKKYQKRRPAVASPEAVVMLNTLIRDSGAMIVVTSSWRIHATVESLAACVKKWGVSGTVIDKTPVGSTRGKEIEEWLGRNEVESFVVLDDESVGMEQVRDRLIVPNSVQGLLWPEVSRAIKILESRP